MFFTAAVILLFCPILFAFISNTGISRNQFAFNSRSTNFLSTLGSIICGNVGIGTFLAIYLFAQASPIIGLSIVISYTLGLILCGVVARRIHAISLQTQTYSLVDLINNRHDCHYKLPVWIPVAFIFIMRSAVQLSALTLIMSEAFGISFLSSLILSTLIAGSYTFIGGYKAATETDAFQAIVIITLMILLMFGVKEYELTERDFFDLGPYKPFLLIGIFAFVPLSPVLAVDNWQRIATAKNAQTAQWSYFTAAIICGAIYASIWLVGMLPSQTGDVLQTFRSLMPETAPWLADILFITCILSSIDTFVMPLVSTLTQNDTKLKNLRLAVIFLFLCVGMVSYLMGDILNSVIAAFNSLTVFLPAVLGVFLLRKPIRYAAWLSLNGGVIVTLLLTIIDINIAAIGGFIFSAIVYVVVTKYYWNTEVDTFANKNAKL